MRKVWDLLKETFRDWREDDAPELAAALSYYTIFSLGPLLLIAVSVAGMLFGTRAAQEEIFSQVRSVVGHDAAGLLQTMMESQSKGKAGMWATIVGIVLLLVTASGVFGHLQKALNQIWEVAPRPDLGLKQTLKVRFLSMTMVLGTGFLLMVSLLLSALLSGFQQFLEARFPGGQAVEWCVSLVIITALFAAIFKVLPDVEIGWSDVWIGALITGVLFNLGKLGITLYLANSSLVSGFGAGGSLVLVLVWVYYSSLLLFFGAEFTQVYAKWHGSQIRPSAHAIRVVQERRPIAS
ncbi:MAG: YihY/virulence factor BrkB family protein [Armatimonadetes bacterium]|nr:YihY/virulence factor BrkB family protein [Armatimonadota bacterium]